MGQNSTEVAYGFGQMGSALSNSDNPIIPPQGMVIVAIQFLSTCVPTIMTPEKLDNRGPGFVSTSGTATDVVGDADDYMNFQGAAQANCDTAATYAAGDDVSVSATTGTIKVGQAVLLVLDADHEGSGLTIDTETPVPIYSGPNQRGVFVTGIAANGDPQLSAQITPAANQHLIFLGPEQGAGGVTCDVIPSTSGFPKGLTLYGRWTEFRNQAAATKFAICYFGR